MTGNTFKEDRRNLYGTIIISVFGDYDTERSMGSDFQQVDSFKHFRMQNRDEFEQASLRDSIQGLLFFFF